MCFLVIQDKLLLWKTIRQFNQLYYSTRCHHIIIILVAFKNPPMSCSHHNTFRCMHSCKYRVGSKRDIFTTKAHSSLCQAACDSTAAHMFALLPNKLVARLTLLDLKHVTTYTNSHLNLHLDSEKTIK